MHCWYADGMAYMAGFLGLHSCLACKFVDSAQILHSSGSSQQTSGPPTLVQIWDQHLVASLVVNVLRVALDLVVDCACAQSQRS